MDHPPHSRLFIVCGSLCKEDVLRRQCAKFGDVQNVKMLPEKGVAYVKFATASQAASAQEALHGKTIRDGRLSIQLKLQLAEPMHISGHVGSFSRPESTPAYLSSMEVDPDCVPPRSRLFLVVPRDCQAGSIEAKMNEYEGLEYVKTDLIQSKGIIFVKYKKASTALKVMEDIHGCNGMLAGHRVKVFLAHPRPGSREDAARRACSWSAASEVHNWPPAPTSSTGGQHDPRLRSSCSTLSGRSTGPGVPFGLSESHERENGGHQVAGWWAGQRHRSRPGVPAGFPQGAGPQTWHMSGEAVGCSDIPGPMPSYRPPLMPRQSCHGGFDGPVAPTMSPPVNAHYGDVFQNHLHGGTPLQPHHLHPPPGQFSNEQVQQQDGHAHMYGPDSCPYPPAFGAVPYGDACYHMPSISNSHCCFHSGPRAGATRPPSSMLAASGGIMPYGNLSHQHVVYPSMPHMPMCAHNLAKSGGNTGHSVSQISAPHPSTSSAFVTQAMPMSGMSSLDGSMLHGNQGGNAGVHAGGLDPAGVHTILGGWEMERPLPPPAPDVPATSGALADAQMSLASLHAALTPWLQSMHSEARSVSTAQPTTPGSTDLTQAIRVVPDAHSVNQISEKAPLGDSVACYTAANLKGCVSVPSALFASKREDVGETQCDDNKENIPPTVLNPSCNNNLVGGGGSSGAASPMDKGGSSEWNVVSGEERGGLSNSLRSSMSCHDTVAANVMEGTEGKPGDGQQRAKVTAISTVASAKGAEPLCATVQELLSPHCAARLVLARVGVQGHSLAEVAAAMLAQLFVGKGGYQWGCPSIGNGNATVDFVAVFESATHAADAANSLAGVSLPSTAGSSALIIEHGTTEALFSVLALLPQLPQNVSIRSDFPGGHGLAAEFDGHEWPVAAPGVLYFHAAGTKHDVARLEAFFGKYDKVVFVMCRKQARYGAVKFKTPQGATRVMEEGGRFSISGCNLTCSSVDLSA